MTKEVLLAMKGMQFELNEKTGEGEPIEIITTGQYFEKNNHKYLMYEEIMEGIDSPISNMIKFDGKTLEVTKKGMVNVHMMFEEGKQNLTDYRTPFGSLMIGINTRKVSIKEEEDRIHIEADYGLDINYEFLSDCQICMDITPKNKAGVSLS